MCNLLTLHGASVIDSIVFYLPGKQHPDCEPGSERHAPERRGSSQNPDRDRQQALGLPQESNLLSAVRNGVGTPNVQLNPHHCGHCH